ncbi:MAG: DUF1501 domain-containing protein [Solirubrobacterales bacterium]
MACHCDEFSRAHVMRQAAAQAGRGLPKVEKGMPLPAGTGLSRRSFLLRSGMAAFSVYGASRLGIDQLRAGVASAQGSSSPVLVSIFLDGGADALSVLHPVSGPSSGLYQDFRPSLALGQGEGAAFAPNSAWRWHPNAAPLDDIQRGLPLGGSPTVGMAVFPTIGYSDPDQSHFTSRHYWEVGNLDPNLRTGWMGRLLDRIGTDDNPLQGLSLDGWLSPGLATASKPVAAIDGTAYDLDAPGVWDDTQVASAMFDALADIGDIHAAGPAGGRMAVGRVTQQASQVREQLSTFGDVTPPPAYPDHWFGESLAALAAMLAAGLDIKCAALSGAGGYDTHDNQKDSFGEDLGTTAQALKAFQQDLEAKGLAERVITMVWSEFGRRPHENGSGTDHGAAGSAFMFGKRVRSQVVGGMANLADLNDDDNLKHTVDYRGVYSKLVGEWFNDEPGAVIDQAGWSSPIPVPDLVT